MFPQNLMNIPAAALWILLLNRVVLKEKQFLLKIYADNIGHKNK